MSKPATILLSLICLIAFGAGGYFIFNGGSFGGLGAIVATSLGGSDANVPDALAVSTPVTPEATAGMKSYQNAAFHFGLLFPGNLVATEYKEKGDALTASFQDPSTNEGFEIFVTPYSGTQIDQARFKLDEPSGTYLEPQNVVI